MFRDYKIDEIEPTRRDKLIQDLEVNLRAIDAIEVQEVNRLYPFKDFCSEICKSDYESHVVVEDDVAICVYGIAKEPVNGMYGIYFLGNKVLENDMRWQMRIIKLSNQVIAEWLKTREWLFNYVHTTNIKTKRWLESIGAVIHPTVKVGDLELFTLKKEDFICAYPQRQS